MLDRYKEIFASKNRIMVVFAHPDDAELYAGGTIARLIADGKQVRVVKMTSGGKGSRKEKISEQDLAALREREDRKAMQVLGVEEKNNVYLRLADGGVDNSLEIIEKVAFQIREFNPQIIITHNPEDVVIRFAQGESWVNHRDHRNTGLSVIDAAYPYSRDLSFFTSQFNTPGLVPGSVNEFLLVDYYDHPDVVEIEMGEFVDKRVKAHACHSSQYDLKAAWASADFFTLVKGGGRRERFRWVVGD